MTIQSFLFLQKLKKAQQVEDSCITILIDDLRMGVISPAGKEKPNPVLDIKKDKNNFRSILEFLKQKNYVTFQEERLGNKEIILVTVLHDGWHLWQTAISMTVSFLFRSITVPIAVSILTTILTLIVTEWLSHS